MAGFKGIERANIRYDPTMDEGGTFLMRCDSCRSGSDGTAFWPITLEFWAPNMGLQRCRACHNAHKRLHHSLTIERYRARNRRYYRNAREQRLQYARDYLEANREYINRRRRERYWAKKSERAA